MHGRRDKQSDLDFDFFFLSEQESDKTKGVKPAPRLKSDLESLLFLMRSETPSKTLLRGSKIYSARYGFGDAAKNGFGSSWLTKSGNIKYRVGIWNEEENSDKSSNYRELGNLTETLESETDLEGTEFFLFTDNSVAEGSFYKGSSSSKLLFELILRLKMLESERRMKIYIIHVPGTRMIQQGTDGLSRGDLTKGVMSGDDIFMHIPLTKMAIEREPKLFPWICKWSGNDVQLLIPEDWFELEHDIVGFSKDSRGIKLPVIKPGTYVWSPHPPIAFIAIEELRRDQRKRQNSTHIVVIPKLMKYFWIGQLQKAADIVFEIRAGEDPMWPSSQHETLLIAICFPFLPCKPWQLRQTPALLEVGRILQRVWKEKKGTSWHLLRQLRSQTKSLDTLPKNVVWNMLQSSRGFKIQNCSSCQ